jgi:hypothetical protein
LRGDVDGDVEVVLEAVGGDEFELVAELFVEVAGFEDEFLVDEVLVDTDVVGAGALGGDGSDVEGGVAGLLEERGEAGELGDEGGLLYTGRGVRAEESAAEGAVAGADGVVGEA